MRALKQLPLILAVAIVLTVSACAADTTPTPTAVPPTETPTAVPSPTPQATATPLPASGVTRANPLPFGSVIQQPPREVSVVQVLRDDAALSFLQKSNSTVPPLPDGQTYLAVKIRVKNIGIAETEMSVSPVDFDVTGDNLIRYDADFSLSDLQGGLFPDGELTGVLVYAIAAGEHNLLLISDPLDDFDAPPVYLALEDGAAISVAPPNLIPTTNGLSRKNPAQLGEEIITPDWRLTVNRVIRGEKAWQRIVEANPYNDPPPAGMTYLLIDVSVQYVGDADDGERIGKYDFKTTGSKNVVYDAPAVVEPEPALDATLYPGGKAAGWIVLQAAADEDALQLIFSPGYSADEDRFVQLYE